MSAFDALKENLLIFIPSVSCYAISFLAHLVHLHRPYQIFLFCAHLAVSLDFQHCLLAVYKPFLPCCLVIIPFFLFFLFGLFRSLLVSAGYLHSVLQVVSLEHLYALYQRLAF